MEIKQNNEQFYVGENPADPLTEMTFTRHGPRLIINHTMVHDELRGKGIGDSLLEEVVKYAREHNLQITPLCPFAKARLEGNKGQYGDVLSKK